MVVFLRKYQLIITIFFCFGCGSLSAQSYAVDSLQIKSYTIIEYRNHEVVDLQLVKVMCDYCTDFQKEVIGNEAKQRTYLERFNPENKLKDGKKQLAIYIRLAKVDFANIKE